MVWRTFAPFGMVEHLKQISLLIYDLQSEDWINTYYMLKGFLKASRPPTVTNEMKCTNEKMTWNTQDTNLNSYVPKANVDHTISGQGTGISTLDHSASTPRTYCMLNVSGQIKCFRFQISVDTTKYKIKHLTTGMVQIYLTHICTPQTIYPSPH